jgi:DNA-binding IclR family transcriptional regulator
MLTKFSQSLLSTPSRHKTNRVAASPAKASGTQAAGRIVDILKLMASEQGSGLRFVEIADKAQLARPTAHRMLKTLAAEGLVFRDEVSKRYSLGPLLIELGIAASRKFKISELCLPYLRRLADQTSDTAFLFIRSGFDAVCLERIQGSYPIQTPSVPVGSRQPLGVNAGGLALLSALGDSDIDEIIDTISPRLAEYGSLTKAELRRLASDAQRRKFAVIGEKAALGVTAIGIAIGNRTGIPFIALSVATTTARMTPTRIKEIEPFLKRAAEEIEQLMLQG